MEKIKDIILKIGKYAIIPVVEIDSLDHVEPLVNALVDGGLPIVEITFRTEAGQKAINTIKKKWPKVILGAGTILTVDQLRLAQDSGADFGVSPGLNYKLVEESLKVGFIFTPGIATPTEIEMAIGYGIRVLKFFPAESLGGLKYLNDIYAPYAHLNLRFNPTGGITLKNMDEYINFKAVYAVGGTWVARKDLISNGRWDEIRNNADMAVNKVKRLRKNFRR